MHSNLPAALIADKVNEALHTINRLIITAPPGAGKSTLLPLTILRGLTEPSGRILMLEPRRLAAKQIAMRMAEMLGERVGETVGYRVRFETKVSQKTRIEVLTEGILTRMLVSDLTLEGVSVIIFDEFHERSINTDLALALSMEMQSVLRDDIRIVLMSATIDTASLCQQFKAHVIESEGRMFHVVVTNFDERVNEFNVSDIVAHYVRKAYREHEGDILAFLPGQSEIERCKEQLSDIENVYPLYGNLAAVEQQCAIAPSVSGSRKVVLATSIAETSLTIEGVRVVVDSGLCRRMIFDKRNGFSHLETVLVSLDMANQRSGRAGRVAEGVCYRLWSKGTEHRMEECRRPEILDADLASLVLDVAAWGSGVEELDWLTPPPRANIYQAVNLLTSLSALNQDGSMTEMGKRISQMACHPRIARMLISAHTPSQKALAADIAAIVEEKDVLNAENDVDITSRIVLLRSARQKRSMGKWGRVAKVSAEYCRLVRVEQSDEIPDSFEVGMLVAMAYPERVSLSMDNVGRYRTASGDNIQIDSNDFMTSHRWVAVATLNAASGRVFLAAPLREKDMRQLLKPYDNVSWDDKAGLVVAQREMRIGKLTVESRPIPMHEVKGRVVEVLTQTVEKNGESLLDLSDEFHALQRRVLAVSGWHSELDIPDVSTESILRTSRQWLPFYLEDSGRLRTTTADLRKICMADVLWNLLPYDMQQTVNRLAPSHIVVPTGSRIKMDYRSGAEAPVLSVRLQECFGLTDTPRVDDGKRPVLMELLSPGFKPVQLTQDLNSFWQGTYFEVRKELKRRYPKHSWPDDPLEEPPTRNVRKPR